MDMNYNFKKITEAINASIDKYHEFIEYLSKKEPKQRKVKKASKIREFLFKKVI
mgnify:CR=1 FL=1